MKWKLLLNPKPQPASQTVYSWGLACLLVARKEYWKGKELGKYDLVLGRREWKGTCKLPLKD